MQCATQERLVEMSDSLLLIIKHHTPYVTGEDVGFMVAVKVCYYTK
jgi:hypothetical protein